MQRFLDLFISINCSTCFGRFVRPLSGAQNCTYSVRYSQNNTAAMVDEMELRSISSTIAAGSSIGLTIPDAVYTVLCSWWWANEPPETCRAIYRNKYIEKTLHLVGCTLEFISFLTVNESLPGLSVVCTRFSWLNRNSCKSEYLAHDHTCISHVTTQFYAIGLYSLLLAFRGV
jgi:hypothetical protein